MLHQPQNPPSTRDPDNWYGVQDKKERKKIQDRLAQRSRRKRLAEMKQARAAAEIQDQRSHSQGSLDSFGSSYDEIEWTPDQYLPYPHASSGLVNPQDLHLGDHDHSSSYLGYPATSAILSPPSPMNQYTVKAAETFSNMMSSVGGRDAVQIPSVTAFAAMYSNAVILQLSCDKASIPMKSSPRQSVPEPLKPIPLQLTVPHLPYIDAIPFPIVRHNLIALNGVIDEEAFCGDLINPSSVSVTGNVSWDPSAWKLNDEFLRKWGFLFCQNVG